MKRLLAAGFLAGVIYLGVAYVPLLKAFADVRYEARVLGHAAMANADARGYEAIEKMVDDLMDSHEGIMLGTHDVTLRADDDTAEVVIRYEYEVSFPLTDHVRVHDFRVAVNLEQ